MAAEAGNSPLSGPRNLSSILLTGMLHMRFFSSSVISQSSTTRANQPFYHLVSVFHFIPCTLCCFYKPILNCMCWEQSHTFIICNLDSKSASSPNRKIGSPNVRDHLCTAGLPKSAICFVSSTLHLIKELLGDSGIPWETWYCVRTSCWWSHKSEETWRIR